MYVVPKTPINGALRTDGTAARAQSSGARAKAHSLMFASARGSYGKAPLSCLLFQIRTRALGPHDAGDSTQPPALTPLSMASRTHIIRVGLELRSMLRRARLCSLARRRLLACALSHRGCWRPEQARTLSALERKPAGWVQMRVPSQELLLRANREGGGGAVAQLFYNGVGSSCQG